MFLLYDKSIVQAEFMVAEGMIIKERLLFVKKHNKIWSKEEIQEAESEGNDWFDIDEGIPIFIRVDFDPSNHQDCKHPAAHLTISQCENCRIPVKNVVSVSEFMKFVLWHFYGKEFKHKMVRFDSPETISEAEREMLHIDWY